MTEAKILTKSICCYSVFIVNTQLTKSRSIFKMFQNSKPKPKPNKLKHEADSRDMREEKGA